MVGTVDVVDGALVVVTGSMVVDAGTAVVVTTSALRSTTIDASAPAQAIASELNTANPTTRRPPSTAITLLARPPRVPSCSR